MSGTSTVSPPQRPPPPKPARSRTLDRTQTGRVAMGRERNEVTKMSRPLSVDESKLMRISRSVSPDFVTSDLSDPKIRRRSYTYTSKQMSQRPPPPRRQISATTDSIVERPQRPPPATRVNKPEQPSVDKKNTSPPARPSRPPPPRAKSLPKVASLTTYKTKRDNNELARRPNSATNDNVHSVKSNAGNAHLGDESMSTLSPLVAAGRRRATSPEGGVMERIMKARNQNTSDEVPPPKPARKQRTPLSSPSREPPHQPPPIFEQQTEHTDNYLETDTPTTANIDTSEQSSENQVDVQFTLTHDSIVPPIPPRPMRPPRPYPPSGNKASRRSPPKRPNGGSPKQRSRPRDPSRRSPRSVHRSQLKKQSEQNTEEQTLVQVEHQEPVSVVENGAMVENGGDGDDGDNYQPDERSTPSLENVTDNHQPPPEEVVPVSTNNESGSNEGVHSPTRNNPSGGVSDSGQSNRRLVKSRTVYERTEQDDMVASVHSSSSPNKGRKLLKSMRKGFNSLSVRKPKRRDESSGPQSPRSQSDSEANSLYPDPLPHGILNPLVVQCVAYLNRETVLKEVGLFRVPGDVAVIKRIRERFLNGEEVDLTDVLDPHTITGLLKLHFREQRVSMIPRGHTLMAVNAGVKAKDVEGVRSILDTIEPIHTATLKIVCAMLARVSANADKNQMTSGTLATSCGPSMFPYLPPSSANGVLKFFIDHSDQLFAV